MDNSFSFVPLGLRNNLKNYCPVCKELNSTILCHQVQCVRSARPKEPGQSRWPRANEAHSYPYMGSGALVGRRRETCTPSYSSVTGRGDLHP
eukprot:782726-Pelagomonas_calceolata.AAC.7